ncbi:class I SAM-dependent methyltransferase [Desulfurobacterium crinifex]
MVILDSLTAHIRYSQVLPYIKDLEKKYGRLRILDAGGGDGSLYEVLRSRGHDVVVLDISDRGEVRADLNKPLPFKDRSFDVVVSPAVVEHLNNWETALEEFKRVGKAVILTTPTPLAKPVLELLAKFNLVNRDHIDDHKHYLTDEEIRKHGYQTRSFLFGLNRLAVYGIELRDELSPWFHIFIVAMLVVLFPKLPPDDLLRHLSAYRYDYNYSKMFLYSYVPSFDFYYPFDVVAGLLHRLIGDYAYIPFQVLAVLLYGLAAVLLLEKTRNNLKTLVVAFVLYLLADRVLLGRPAVFASGLFLLAYALRDRGRLSWHLPIAVLLPLVYYLFFIYVIPLIAFRRLRIIYVCSLLLGLFFWINLGELDYIQLIFHILTAKANRLIAVAEGQTFAVGLLSVLALSTVPLLFFWRKDIKTVLTSAYFLASNQIRYVEVVVPLWSSLFRFLKVESIPWKLSVPLLLFFLSPYAVVSQPEAVSFDRPVKVAFSNMPEMYRSVYFSKANIQVIPSMEVGWMPKEVQLFLKDLTKGKLDCSKVREFRLDYVVEDTLAGKLPSCVELERVEGKLRVLRVKK